MRIQAAGIVLCVAASVGASLAWAQPPRISETMIVAIRGHVEARIQQTADLAAMRVSGMGREREEAIQRAREAAKGWVHFDPVFDTRDGITAVIVTSGRATIADKAAKAIASGGSYTPTSADRNDVIGITCGIGTLPSEIFNCAKIVVRDAAGATVPPIAYRAGVRTNRNALGVSWPVREVVATYRVRPLAKGFSVEYFGTEGISWVLEVSEDTATDELLLNLSEK